MSPCSSYFLSGAVSRPGWTSVYWGVMEPVESQEQRCEVAPPPDATCTCRHPFLPAQVPPSGTATRADKAVARIYTPRLEGLFDTLVDIHVMTKCRWRVVAI